MDNIDNMIGLKHNEEYFTQLCLSIIDIAKDNFHWEGSEIGVNLTINGLSQFIPNEANEEEEIQQLWNKAKKK